MKRIETACYALIASAFVLGGLLITQVANTPNTAEAGLVISRDDFTLLSARTRSGEESLFVINNNTNRLLIYTLNLTGNRIELAGGADLTTLFNTGAGEDNDADDRRRR